MPNVTTIHLPSVPSLAAWFDLCDAHDLTPTPIPDVVIENEIRHAQEHDGDDSGVSILHLQAKGADRHASRPHANVVQYGRWYIASGQDTKAGIGSSGMEWQLVTTDRAAAVAAAHAHMTT